MEKFNFISEVKKSIREFFMVDLFKRFLPKKPTVRLVVKTFKEGGQGTIVVAIPIAHRVPTEEYDSYVCVAKPRDKPQVWLHVRTRVEPPKDIYKRLCKMI